MLTAKRVPIQQWHWEGIESGSKDSILLTFQSGDNVQGWIPVNVIRGSPEGPVLLLLAAVHGDEYEGVQTAIQLFDNLQPEHIQGTLVIIPIANMFSYEGETRITPQDGRNLAREFPGDPEGTLTQRLAWHIHHRFIAKANFLLDLHSGGEYYAIPPLVGYYYDPRTEIGQRSQQAAEAFGLDVLWGHGTIAPGRTVSSAQQLGIPWLYTEAYGGKRILPEQQQSFYWGTIRLMKHLNMLRSNDIQIPPAPPIRFRLHGDGNFDQSETADTDGFFIPAKRLLDYVQGGERIGAIYNWQGKLIQDVCSTQEGVLVMLVGNPRVKKGDHLYLIADRLNTVDEGE